MQKPVAFVERITPWYLFGMAVVMLFSGITPVQSYSASHRTRVNKPLLRPAKTKIRRVVRRIAWDHNVRAEPQRGMYQRFFRVKATAYVPRDFGCEGGRYTATQRDGQASHGIAVDPGVIPLGTRLWIPGYGHAIADDTGSMIRGHHIDVRMQNTALLNEWGVRDLRVYVLSSPE